MLFTILFFIFYILGLCVYASEIGDFMDQNNGHSYGWAFGLGWAGFFFAVAAAIVEGLEEFL